MNIASIQFLGQSRKDRRKLKIKLSNGAKITAGPCHESWEQWGGTLEDLTFTSPVVEKFNDWLHGGVLPL